MKRVSELIGMDIFNDSAKLIGRVHDVIIDLQKGEVVRLSLQPIHAANPDDAKRLFRDQTVLYKSVRAVEKIIIVSSAPIAEDEPSPEEQAPARPMPYRNKYGYGASK